MKVAVTGANGFLGSWLTRALLEQGHEVCAFVRKTSDLTLLKGVNCILKYGDVTDLETLLQALSGVDVVFHLAAHAAVNSNEKSLLSEINVQGTQNVVIACKKLKIPKLIHVSSVVAIGASIEKGVIFNEMSPPSEICRQIENYESKRKGEEIVLKAARAEELFAVVVNPSLIYGAGDVRKAARKGIVQVARGKVPFYPTGGVNVVAVEDVVEGLILAWQRGHNGERYILGGQNLSMKELFFLVAENAGVSPPKWAISSKVLLNIAKFCEHLHIGKTLSTENVLSTTLFHWYDSSKATRELGYKPRSIKKAIKAQWIG